MEPRVGIEPTVAFAAGLQNQSFTIQGIGACTNLNYLTQLTKNVIHQKINNIIMGKGDHSQRKEKKKPKKEKPVPPKK